MESKFKYTSERNVQIVIALLKAHGIRRVIASPGTTNMTFVVSVENDPWFRMWSSVDERSAAYLACGMAAETGEPVVISCTGATASRNYMPGLTEAYYRKLPVLAITSTRGNHKVGHLIDQQIDRRALPNDIAMESVTIPMVKDKEDERMCEIEANKAILALKLNGGGPAHINMYTKYSHDFSVKEIPHVNAIYRHTAFDEELPRMPHEGRIVVRVGSHADFSERLTKAVDKFCATYDAVVLCDHTSGYRGKYEVHCQMVCGQRQWHSPLAEANLCVHIGEVSGDAFNVRAKHAWRVSPDGKLRDIFMGVYMKTDPSPAKTYYPILSNIMFENNEFKNSAGLVAFITSTGNVIFKDNIIINDTPRKNEVDYRGGFWVAYSQNTKIVNNVWIKSNYVATPGVFAETSTTKNLLVAGNRLEEKK